MKDRLYSRNLPVFPVGKAGALPPKKQNRRNYKNSIEADRARKDFQKRKWREILPGERAREARCGTIKTASKRTELGRIFRNESGGKYFQGKGRGKQRCRTIKTASKRTEPGRIFRNESGGKYFQGKGRGKQRCRTINRRKSYEVYD